MAKKVAIVSTGDQRHITMISLFTELFDREKIEYELICIDRYGEKQKGYNKCKIYQFEFNDGGNSTLFKKALKYLEFAYFAINILSNNKYDFVVVWNENTAALLSLYLRKYYPGRYCVNVRDVDFVKRWVIKKGCKIAILSSAFTTTPSPYMINYPKGYDYTLVLSQNDKILKECTPKYSIRKQKPIRISFIGKVRFYDADRYLIDALANDERFLLQFFGVDSDYHKSYIEEKRINNVVLKGRYRPEQTKDFLAVTDIIHSFYGINFPNYRIAAPIKFGYAPALYMPALVTAGTYLEDVGKKYGFVYAINFANPINTLADDIFEWYSSLNFENLKNGCDRYCAYVDSVNRNFERTCLKAIKGE